VFSVLAKHSNPNLFIGHIVGKQESRLSIGTSRSHSLIPFFGEARGRKLVRMPVNEDHEVNSPFRRNAPGGTVS